MTFDQLNYGDVFYIDGAPYQCFKKYSRICTAIVLDPVTYQHVPDPKEDTGIKTTLYSDMRINTNNATPQECADYLLTLRILNDE